MAYCPKCGASIKAVSIRREGYEKYEKHEKYEKEEKIVGLFYLALFSFLGIGFVVLALITLVPNPDASKPNFLGYYTHCSFVPVSTITLFILSAVFSLLGFKRFKRL